MKEKSIKKPKRKGKTMINSLNNPFVKTTSSEGQDFWILTVSFDEFLDSVREGSFFHTYRNLAKKYKIPYYGDYTDVDYFFKNEYKIKVEYPNNLKLKEQKEQYEKLFE